MTKNKRLTLPQERAAYREVVGAVLIEFLGQDIKSSRKLVAEWWSRLSKTDAYKSGVFLHDEPLHTAADLIDLDRIELSVDQKQRYRKFVNLRFHPADTTVILSKRKLPDLPVKIWKSPASKLSIKKYSMMNPKKKTLAATSPALKQKVFA